MVKDRKTQPRICASWLREWALKKGRKIGWFDMMTTCWCYWFTASRLKWRVHIFSSSVRVPAWPLLQQWWWMHPRLTSSDKFSKSDQLRSLRDQPTLSNCPVMTSQGPVGSDGTTRYNPHKGFPKDWSNTVITHLHDAVHVFKCL